MWRVPYLDLGAQYEELRPELDAVFYRVMSRGSFILREDVARFEENMKRYLGVKHVIGVASGSDALRLAVLACGLGWGGGVFTHRYAFVASAEAIIHAGACPEYNWITEYTKAVMPVHMNGRYCPLPHKGLPLIEDACQALGAKYEGRMVGTEGIGCFSCAPMKTLSCAGDGGFVATNDAKIADKITLLRNHGSRDRGATFECYGFNSRLDNLHAAILNVKLPCLDGWIKRKRELAAIYEAELPDWVRKPPPPSDGPYFDTYSSYVIGGSPELLEHMRGNGIECFSHIRNDLVSLPIYPQMSDAHIEQVIEAVKDYANTGNRI